MNYVIIDYKDSHYCIQTTIIKALIKIYYNFPHLF